MTYAYAVLLFYAAFKATRDSLTINIHSGKIT